uniref:Uncharacterized protein n=1 Tax=Panagrolaimus davidi TaxID=227884 RepID=A0A914Q5P4_9BILA
MDLPVGSVAAVIPKGPFDPNAARTIPSRRAQFFANYFLQNFSLRDSIIHYIEKNPKTWELYQKLIKSCKYFFVKNTILVVRRLSYNKNDLWFAKADGDVDKVLIDLNKIKCKFWVTEKFDVFPYVTNYNPNILSSNIPKLYKCDAMFLHLKGQTISSYDHSFFISDAEEIFFEDVTVKDENGKLLPLEKLIEGSIKVETIYIFGPTMTSKTFNELTKLPHFANLDYLTLDGLHEDFDVEDFYINQRTLFRLYFDSSVSDGYKARIKEIIDEINATEEFNYRPPVIQFYELDE